LPLEGLRSPSGGACRDPVSSTFQGCGSCQGTVSDLITTQARVQGQLSAPLLARARTAAMVEICNGTSRLNPCARHYSPVLMKRWVLPVPVPAFNG